MRPKQGLKQKYLSVFRCGLFFHDRRLLGYGTDTYYGCPKCGSWWVAYIP